MMMTREYLLRTADEFIDVAYKFSLHPTVENITIAAGHASVAQACVALAKELRESKDAPTYEQVGEAINVLKRQ